MAALSHQAWSTEEGLPQASVHQVLQSREGYLWLATEGGAVRFDGVGFKILRHDTDPAFTSDDISAIAQDGTGALWFGTSDGLVRDQNSALRRFTARDGLLSMVITSLATASDGSLLVLTAGGLVRFDGSAFHALETGEPVDSLQSAADGTVLLLGNHEGLRYDHGAIAAATLPLPSTPADPILGLGTGPDGATWVRTARTVTLFTPQGQRVWHAGTDLPGSRVQALSVSRDGAAWIGAAWIGTNRGLFTVGSQPGSRVQPIPALRAEPVLCIIEDREGDEWVGTETSGLHVLRPRKFWSEASTEGDSITAVVQSSDGAAWFGTRDRGLRRLSKIGADVPVPGSMLTSSVILALAPGTHGDLWAGTPDGLNHIEPKINSGINSKVNSETDRVIVHRYTSADGLLDDFVRSVLVEADGSVWVGTRHGLAHLQNGAITTLMEVNGLASDSIGALFESRKGELWIGTSGGLSRLSNGRLQSFAAAQGLPGSIVTAIAQDAGGGIWVGVHGAGLSRFDGNRFARIQSPDLPLEIHALAVDAAGFLWLRADHGVYRVPLAQLNDCAGASGCPLRVEHYGILDGMPSDELPAEGSPSIWQAADGKLWFATRKGLALTDPLHLPINTVQPPVAIERFAVDDIDQTDQRLTSAVIHIPAGYRSYSFDYAGLSYTSPSKTRYRYLLEGFDRNWIDAGSRRTAYYTSLPAHAYRFRVAAQNNDGVWSSVAAQVRFTVLPPFYLRWWFYALVLIAAAGTVALLLQLRVRSLQTQFSLVLNERNRMAREIHDTLAQDFVGASLQLEIISQLLNANKLPQAKQQIQETRLYIKNGLEAARQSIWNLRANAAQSSLPARLTTAVERFAQTHAAPKLKIGGAFRTLPAEIENEVTRIAEESLSNVARHAAATQVAVELLYGRDTLLLTVRDNGKGFVETAAREAEGHYGLRGMSERAAALGAKLTIASREGEGTSVTLTVPLPVAREGQTS